ncbi:redoxin family protein [Sphingobacterium faecale]|uniref:Redoxin domain-containing protein n=1 Tax=Sphingobacterium faecale TaxID=2803775 RepID=A0ABS1R921_9SPHI|nr:redoxin family protein [Sphingobacterium faecale]MBL1410800.1 redoxin domain-containing protein [Sphingobacterium faecale]
MNHFLRAGSGLPLFKALILFFVLFSSLVFTQAVAQTQSGPVLHGEVRSAADGQPIEGALVSVYRALTLTDKEGKFTINIYRPSGDIAIKCDGYLAQRISYEHTDTLLNISLQIDERPYKIVYEKPTLGTVDPLYIGDAIPEAFWDFRMPLHADSLGRDSLSLADFRDDSKVLIIDFWPTWCGPCVESVLWLDSVTQAKKYENITFISICSAETEERLKAFIERIPFKVPTLFDGSFLVNRMLTRYKGYYGLLMVKEGKLWGAPDKQTLTIANLDRIERRAWEEVTVAFHPAMEKISFTEEVRKEPLK